jgi:predicted nicotinamide N-methyase
MTDLSLDLVLKGQQALQRTLPDARLETGPLPGVEEIRLALINADYQTGPLPADVMHAVIAKPAYWAFCWGSGLALAQWLLAHPDIVAGKRVADVGCGCGIGAIAAKLAGATHVVACDNDPDALLISQINADINGVGLEYAPEVNSLSTDFDLVLMADVLYDKSNYPLLQTVKGLAPHIIVADSRISAIDDTDFTLFHHSQALTYPNLGEFDEFKDVRFFQAFCNLAAD